ncbi:MAG TPA: biotin/lipoyl-containing protein [Candidatus Binataceae bacterium]|nr:biotin/lipoyl-containing protein [Candidatus Binataceae bacterium]
MATRYTAALEGGEHEIELEELAADSYSIKVAGGEHRVDVRRIGPGAFSIIIDDRSFDLDVVREGDELIVVSRRGTTRITLLDAARRARLRKDGSQATVAGRAEVKAMMPGRIVNVLVQPGDTVTRQQGVVVVEAMKMENELKSPKDGKVIEVKVEAGQTVEKGELLVVIE